MTRPVQIFAASTLYGAATVCAAIDAGRFGPAARRILLVCNNAVVPETTPAFDESPSFAALRSRFDEVRSWNAEIYPQHPSDWGPRLADVQLWERQLRRGWELGDAPVELVLESIQVNPARALASIFSEALLHVYADGVMSYGPTRNKLPDLLHGRLERLLYVDLVPGLTPLLLTEYGVAQEAVPGPELRAVLTELAACGPDLGEVEPGGALLLGQYLSALGLIEEDEEEALHGDMLRAAVAAGHRQVVFKPHPSAPLPLTRSLLAAAEQEGVRLRVLDEPLLAETAFEVFKPELVVGCFSTGLFTARALYGLPVARVGTELVLRRLQPYENSNRVPVTLAHLLLGRGSPAGRRGVGTDGGLLHAARAVRPAAGEAVEWLTRHLGPDTARYFTKRRLSGLGLPGDSR
ncbi:polysialyltransferase family glycosyltransferase [Streptacidiphilus monticola]